MLPLVCELPKAVSYPAAVALPVVRHRNAHRLQSHHARVRWFGA